MKICFFHLKAHAAFNSKSDAAIGGTLVQMRIIAQKLAQDPTFSISFVTGDFGQPDKEIYEGISVYKSARLEHRFWQYIIAPFKIWGTLKKVNGDVYIASSAGIETGLLALFCKINRKRMIYRTAHDWDCNGKYIENNGFAGKCFKYGLKNATSIVAQTHEQQNLLSKRYGLHSVVIKNSFVIPQDSIVFDKKYVLWVSRCEPWKNPNLFIELARQLPEYFFVMICPLQKYQEGFFKKTKEDAAQYKNIEFIEFVPFEKIQSYFEHANIFVGTSEYEGFPNTFLQACIAHTPIVSYKVNPDSFITAYNAGYVALGNTEKLRKI